MSETPREACGIVGVYTPGDNAARTAFFGLFSLQHRGQESAGIATTDGRQLHRHTEMGLVHQAFHEFDLHRLPGHMAIGHTRYSTTGSSTKENAQPVLVSGLHGQLALGHNGNVINAAELRREAVDQWEWPFTTTTDSEVIAHILANAPGEDWGERAAYTMRKLRGAYSLVVQLKDALLAIRDPLGVRPLCLGKLDEGWVVASESCALDNLGARFIREVEPGEVLLVDAHGVRTVHQARESRRALCVFETIYFARPDSILDSRLVYISRQEMGRQLAREHPADADIVIAIPDSATAAGIGYAHGSGIPFYETLVKNRYVGRTFIQPDQRLRDEGVRLKLTPLREVIEGKRLVIVDDSIVRGTTTRHLIDLLRSAGAKEIHLRVCAPPIRYPCHYGIDMPNRAELLASDRSVEEVREELGVDSLGFLDVPSLYRSVAQEGPGFCTACFTGDYTVPVQVELDKFALERLPLRV